MTSWRRSSYERVCNSLARVERRRSARETILSAVSFPGFFAKNGPVDDVVYLNGKTDVFPPP